LRRFGFIVVDDCDSPRTYVMAQGKNDEQLATMFFRDGNYEKAAALYGRL
jgi:hypothetical protein